MEPVKEFLINLPTELVSVNDIDIRTLSEISDERDTYLSIYLPIGSLEDAQENRSFISSREDVVGKALDKELGPDFKRTMEMVLPSLGSDPIDGEKGRIIFGSSKSGLLHFYRISSSPPTRRFVLDTSPYILPLAKLRNDHKEYGMLILDSHQARFYNIASDHCDLVQESSFDLMNKHKKGGMSQARFSRLRSGAIMHFIKEVKEDLLSYGGLNELQGIVIAGPGEPKKLLVKELPKEVSDRIIGTLDIDIDTGCSDLVRLGNEFAAKDDVIREAAAIDDLRSALMKGDPSIHRIEELIETIGSGRVYKLVVLKDASIQGWKCGKCLKIESTRTPPEICPACGGPTTGVNVVEEVVESAERTNVSIEFVQDSAFLSSIGGIGALLRY